MKRISLAWQIASLVFWLAVAAASFASDTDQAPGELPPPVPAEQPPGEVQEVTAPDTSILQFTVRESDPSAEGVFSPFPGKSPCGEFDAPYNDYFGDTRVYRGVFMGHAWATGEYLAMMTKGVRLPPLVTTSPIGTVRADAGVLGEPGTTLLFGNDDVHDTWRSGGRFAYGYWFTPEHIAGIETNFMWLDGRNITFGASSTEFPILAHPTETAGVPTSTIVAFEDAGGVEQTGATLVQSDTGLFSGEVLWRRMMIGDCDSRIDFVCGYRYLRLFDRLRTDDAIVSEDLASGFAVDTEVTRVDLFESRNDFHGSDLGLVYRWWDCCWALTLTGKVALGARTTETTIDGETVAFDPVTDTTTVTVAGILAQPTNIGQYVQTEFAAVGEFGARVEYAVTPQLRLTFGYDALWFSSVNRVNDSIDLASSPFVFRDGNFWAHGLTVGGYYDF